MEQEDAPGSQALQVVDEGRGNYVDGPKMSVWKDADNSGQDTKTLALSPKQNSTFLWMFLIKVLTMRLLNFSLVDSTWLI